MYEGCWKVLCSTNQEFGLRFETYKLSYILFNAYMYISIVYIVWTDELIHGKHLHSKLRKPYKDNN